jgi:hypothetical protein
MSTNIPLRDDKAASAVISAAVTPSVGSINQNEAESTFQATHVEDQFNQRHGMVPDYAGGYLLEPEDDLVSTGCCKNSDACQEKYAWASAALYAVAVSSFVTNIHDVYAAVGWTAATLVALIHASALRHERLHGPHTALVIRRAAPLWWVAAGGLLAYSAWCVVDGLRLGQTLAPPYDGNRFLGSISAFVAMNWAVRLASWARKMLVATDEEPHYSGGGGKTAGLLKNDFGENDGP